MVESCKNLLLQWDTPLDVITKFAEENVDIDALEHLIEEDLVSLIPSIGNRAKFRVKWNEWKEQLNEERNTDVDISSKTSSATTTSLTSLQIEQLDCSSDSGRKHNFEKNNALYTLIDEDKSLRHLLSNRKLSKSERSKLARVVIPHLVNKTPGGVLTPVQIKTWAEYAAEIFPEDDITFYFFTVAPTNSDSTNQECGSRQLPSKSRRYYGCFWDRWNNYRKVLRENNSITCNRRKDSVTSTSSDNNLSSRASVILDPDLDPENQNILKIAEDFQGPEITEYLIDAWNKSRKERLDVLANGTTTAEYINRFQVLRNQNVAVKLIDIDYKLCTALETDSTPSLAHEIIKSKEIIIQCAREKAVKFRDQAQKNSVNQIFALLDSDNEDIHGLTAALLLLPYLFSSGGKISAKGGRASRAEASRAFVLLAPLADAEGTLNERRNTLKNKKRQLQPLVVAIGKTWVDVTSAYVYIDEPLYHFNSILDAVHMCFKSFFAFDLKYPLECEHVWLLIQKGLLSINLPADKTIISVNQVISSLKLN